MKIYQNYLKLILVVAVFASFVGFARAASVPTLSLSPIAGSDQVQVTVYGADPNMSILLYYPSTASVASTNIGTTNSNGYLTTTISSATYNIASGASVYVIVDSQASPAIIWPSYTSTNSGNISLSQSSLTLTSGQSAVVSAGVSASLNVSSNSNPSIANASISNNQITVTGFNTGTTNITICATGIGCSTLYVTVQSSSPQAPSISFNPSTVSVMAGQSQNVGITGVGNYYVQSNSNSTIASLSISGAVITVNGISAGGDIASICASTGSSATVCSNMNITVTQSPNSNTVTTASTLSFSQSNINLNVGQTQSVAIYGGSIPYYVSTNQSPSSVGANVSGTNVTLSGIAFGGSNVTICAVGNQCGSLYVYVAPSGTSVTSAAGTVTQAPDISSFSVSSNNTNGGFINSGNVITLTFSTDQIINIPQVTIGGSSISSSGSGSGPYTATYTVTGNETLPLPVKIRFTNPDGSSNQTYFWVGNTSTGPTAVGTALSVSGGGTFTAYLHVGSTGSQVTALQKRLSTLGIYSGPITGTYGSLTQAAVKAYQSKHSIDQLGVVGPATRALLNEGI